MLFPALHLLYRSHLPDCLPKDLPSWKMGGAGKGGRPGASCLWEPRFSAARAACEHQAARQSLMQSQHASPHFAHTEHVTLWCPGLACLACLGSNSSNSWTVG